jgi:hypothetical protein
MNELGVSAGLLSLAEMGAKYDELNDHDQLVIQEAVTKSTPAMNDQEISNTLYS